MASQTGYQIITTNMVPNISISKGNKIWSVHKKFSVREHFVQKSGRVREISSRPLFDF